MADFLLRLVKDCCSETWFTHHVNYCFYGVLMFCLLYRSLNTILLVNLPPNCSQLLTACWFRSKCTNSSFSWYQRQKSLSTAHFFPMTHTTLSEKQSPLCAWREQCLFKRSLFFHFPSSHFSSTCCLRWNGFRLAIQTRSKNNMFFSAVRFTPASKLHFSSIKISAAMKYSCRRFYWASFVKVHQGSRERGAGVSHWSLTHLQNLHISSRHFNQNMSWCVDLSGVFINTNYLTASSTPAAGVAAPSIIWVIAISCLCAGE